MMKCVGVRFADFASAFPAGINIAATWDRNLTFLRGAAMGAEFRGKGANIALGPMMNLVCFSLCSLCYLFGC